MPPLSRAVLTRLFHEVLSTWGELWPALRALNPRVEGVVTTPMAAEGAPGEERYFYALVAARLGEARGLLRLCLPLGIIRGLLREEHDRYPGPPPAAATELHAGALAAAPVTLSVRLETPPVSLRSLLRRQPGEVLDLRLPADTPFTLYVSGSPKFRGQAGLSAGRMAVKVTGEV